jgi:AraC family L-rhamnose operon transcriptional activator RhaR/AraC family L-rhamnose operon regulatory protein RhaS
MPVLDTTVKENDRLPWVYSDPQFPLSILPVYNSQGYPLHAHDFTELVIIRDGWGRHVLGEQEYPIQAGDVFVVAGDNVHAYPETHNLGLVNVLFKPDLLSQHAEALHALPGYHALFELEPRFRRQRHCRSRLRLTLDDLVWVSDVLARMLEELNGQSPGHRTMLLAQLVQLVIFLSRRYSAVPRQPENILLQIGEVISHMESAFADPLTLEELAELAKMSPRHLIRRFREGTGLPPIEYLIHLRIRKATTLLRETNRSISDIAAAVGVPDSNYFSRQYKRVTGVSPRTYRKQHLPRLIPPTQRAQNGDWLGR